MTEILIVAEQLDGGLHPVVGELVTAGQGLEGDRALVVLGADLSELSKTATTLDVDKIYVVEHRLLLEQTSEDLLVAALEQVCRQTEPRVVLIGRTFLGRDVGPRLAYRLGVGVAQDCIGLKQNEDSGRVVVTRPVYGGNAVATMAFGQQNPQVVIVRPRIYESIEKDVSRNSEIIPLTVNLDSSMMKVRHIERVKSEVKGVRLEDAQVVVAGGRGIGGPEPFSQLSELADILDGAVGASRAVCDAGWADHSLQIGLTGATITPDLYITVGISGASQHMAGCSGAKHIVAVNKDANANIFKEARFGVVGDWSNILPSFIAAVRDLSTG